ncbi:cytochrome P450 [Streptomyces iranensis]|uniref:Cytochrome P450 n=1 Tax=Streptomyces iranensis TaxID=576784 RepID=A0A060ZAP0_9ACTN|nr:cytochrome P450 [Streptomyces iranensis]MBP2068783.1 cytochrome P450 [Streptomyces iranensis]CDR01158.1 cytochrome P450 [Streptomyces iranensis]
MTNPLHDLMDYRNRPDPYQLLARIREAGPIPVEDGKVVIYGRYDDCNQILRHKEMGNDTKQAVDMTGLGDPADHQEMTPEDLGISSIFFMDPPGHGRQRKFISKSFTPRIVSSFQPSIARIVDDLFAKFRDRGEFDVVDDLAYPMSIGIICDIFGIPEEERQMLKDWSVDLALSSELPTLGAATGSATRVFAKEEIERIFRTMLAVHAYFGDLIQRRRRNPGDDLVSSLIATESNGDRLTRYEVTSALATLFIAAHESTTNLVSNGILALLRNPDQLTALREEPGVITTLVDEALRYDPPVQLATRISRTHTTIGGHDLRPGDVVVVLMAAANRDPRAYHEPEAFDVRRKTKNVSLAFGAGAHFCIGSSLAKLEAELALSAFAERLRDPELDESSLNYRRHIVVRGLQNMTVSFKP